jgi:hypothetical protein
MYSSDLSAPALAVAEAFVAAGHRSVLELGFGQGLDTLYLVWQGLQVTAPNIATGTVEIISAKTRAPGLTSMVTLAAPDMREPLPLSDDSGRARTPARTRTVWVRPVAQLARWARAFRRFRPRRSSSESPPQTPVSWQDSMAQLKQVALTSQRRQTTLAFSVWRIAG